MREETMPFDQRNEVSSVRDEQDRAQDGALRNTADELNGDDMSIPRRMYWECPER